MIRVTVPCSTSNLGAGFDCIGLALDRQLTVSFEAADEYDVVRRGTLAELDGEAGDDLVVQTLAQHGITGSLVLDSNIPVGKGLGSSAAARVAALAIIRTVQQQSFDYDDVLAEATSLEGHPDNAAPAILGGLVAVVPGAGGYRPIPLLLSPDIGFAFAAPQATVSTRAARRALPEQIPHAAATRTIARTVALLEGLAEADPELLRAGFDDELHVPFRIGMIPGGVHAMDAAMQAGAWAATVSGSGSGIIAAAPRGVEEKIAAAMREAFSQATSEAAIAFPVAPDFSGTQIENDA